MINSQVKNEFYFDVKPNVNSAELREKCAINEVLKWKIYHKYCINIRFSDENSLYAIRKNESDDYNLNWLD